MARSTWSLIAPIVLVSVLVLSAMVVLAAPLNVATPAGPQTGAQTTSSSGASTLPGSTPAGRALGTNSVLAAAVEAKEQTILADGGNLSTFHPPNLHQAPPLTQTHGVVIPLYSVAPAPMGVAYYGLSNTTGTTQGTSLNTTSLAGTWNTTDPIGTAAELFDTSSGNAAGEFGAQLNSVLVNVTLDGQTSFGASSNAPSACPTTSFYTALPGNVCPNEFWLQNYIEYTESTHTLQVGDEIWNFSNPSADWASTQSSGTHTIAGFGSVQDGELYALSGNGYAFSVVVAPPFSLVLYDNYTQGPCHTDSVPGTGITSCGSVSTTEPVNELFMNYTIRSSSGARVCPTSEPTGRICGEYDDVFFNSVGASNPSGVPATGPNDRIGSATIQANGTAYDPVGLTNDFEFDYGIGSDDGATNSIVYQDGIVGVNYCQNANAAQAPNGGIECSSYSATPAAVDYGGETGETSTGEMAYWAPQGVAGPGPTLLTGTATPITHLVTGPSLLVGLWNMTGSTYTGSQPYPAYTGGEQLSYKNIAPANAWVGIAQDQSPGVTVTSQFYFQVAPTFGFYSYWTGSGGAPTPTTLGANLWLPTGWYTVEVLLSGYEPVIQQVDLTDAQAPDIKLIPTASTGAYTPDWAFSNSDLANLSVSASNVVPSGSGTSVSPYIISAGAPTVGTVRSISGGQVQIGEPGSVSWLFSNLNDYLFTQWIGAFVNSTTAVTQFNPAPSFTMEYPSWQLPALAEFDVPTTDGFQYYLLNTQNLAVIGATNIYSWANSEATTLYSFVVNNGANDLIASNTFAVSNHGLEFINGGTTTTFTINGNVVTPVLKNTRNVVWGNTFVPDPQTSFTGLESFTTQDSLTLSEAFDRIYNNAFNSFSATVNSTANAAAADTTWWNATCVSGYAPLSQETYPGSGPAGVCEPLSYAQSLDGFTMIGAIDGTSYQGGNFWAAYGNEPNPYGNIPFKAHTTSLTSPTAGEIAATTFPFAGDYAPLIPYSVSELSFSETGLASSATTTAFEMRLFNSTGYQWFNDTATSIATTLHFYVPFGAYTYVAATTLTGSAANPATGSVSFTTPSQLVTIIFAAAFTVTFTETGLIALTRWYVNISGQSSLTSTSTTISTSLPNGAYSFTAAAVTKQYAWSSSPSFTVSGTALGVGVTFAIPVILVSPNQGPVGATVTVSGAGFTAGTALASLVFDGVTISSCSSGSLTTNSAGTFSCTFAVPSGTSGTSVVATNAGSQTATGTFTVTTPAISVSPAAGPAGTTVTVAGTGFSVSSTVGLVFDNVAISSCTSGSLGTDASGDFSCTFAVPSGTSGTTVLATDAGGSTATGTFTVTAPAISVTPGQGPIGATVTVTGSGFTGSSTLASLVFDNQAITICTAGSLTTTGSGAFSCTFTVPSGTSGTTVTATDVGGAMATATFTVTVPAISVTPGQGPVGATVTVSGTGFTVSSTVGLVFDSLAVASCASGSLDTDLSGDFSCTFAVPSGTSGSSVLATDSGGQTASGTFTVTTLSILVTPGQGPVGATVTVSGTGFSVLSTVGLVFDTVTITSCTSGSLGADSSGDFSCTLAVPSGASGTTVTATDSGGATAVGAFMVTTPTISVTPGQGPIGATVTVSGTGFSVSSPVGLVFDNVAITSCTSGSLGTDSSGAFSCTFAVPSGTSGTSVLATDAGGQTATGTFTVTAPAISVTPGQGPVGATVTVSGTGFSVSSPVGLLFDNIAITSCTSGSLGTSPSGAFSCTFLVPSGTSGTTVTATDVGGAMATGAFEVTTLAIVVSPGQGPVGATVTVSGNGFTASGTVGLKFDGVTISSCTTGSLTASGSGAFSCTFKVPSGTAGTTVTATDVTSATATGAFTVTTPQITVSPGQGPRGETVTVSGTGFSVSSAVKLLFDKVTIVGCTSGSLTTGATGAFTCTFTVPSGTSGTTVTATDVGGQHATGKFTVTTPKITVAPKKGPVGATVTISGTGFSVSSAVALEFDNVAITSCTSGSLATSATGTFSCTFAVPTGTSGTTVTATDSGGQYAIGTFKVTTPKITVSPKQGAVGATVTVSGTGFSVSSLVGLVFDGVTITSCTGGGGLTTLSTGAFSCTFKVPTGTSGTSVVATDAGGTKATATFKVTTPAIPAGGLLLAIRYGV
ncbi:MAG: thermopsin family protease [Thermoplasmata archaeon]